MVAVTVFNGVVSGFDVIEPSGTQYREGVDHPGILVPGHGVELVLRLEVVGYAAQVEHQIILSMVSLTIRCGFNGLLAFLNP